MQATTDDAPEGDVPRESDLQAEFKYQETLHHNGLGGYWLWRLWNNLGD
jgi:hypothetical protein